MNYGITTVQDIAWVINRDLIGGTKPAASPWPAPAPARNTPDEKRVPRPARHPEEPGHRPECLRGIHDDD